MPKKEEEIENAIDANFKNWQIFCEALFQLYLEWKEKEDGLLHDK